MITLNANIKLKSRLGAKLTNVSSNILPNNVSSDVGSIIGSKNDNSKPFVLGYSSLGDGSLLLDSVNYFISSNLSNENGEISFDLEAQEELLDLALNPNFFRYSWDEEASVGEVAFDIELPIRAENVSIEDYSFADERITSVALSETLKENSLLLEGTFVFEEYVSQDELKDLTLYLQIFVNPKVDNGIYLYGDKDFELFTIVFDREVYPKSIFVDGVEFFSQNNMFSVFGLPLSNIKKIEINELNKPNAPLIIKSIYIASNLILDYTKLKSLEYKTTYRSDNTLPSYGIIVNSGNIEFNDQNDIVRGYLEQDLLVEDVEVELYLNNNLTKKENIVAKAYTNEWNYDEYSRLASVSLKDELEQWQEIQIKGFSYDPRNPNSVLPNRSMADLYDWLLARTSPKYAMLQLEELDETTREILENTIIPYPFLNDGTLWEQWTKVCQVCALYIYKNKGRTICSYTYGS